MPIKSRLAAKAGDGSKVGKLLEVVKLFKNSVLHPIDGSAKKYPKVIQLPITYRCNSKCVMCNIWQMDTSNEANIEEFTAFMKDDIFKEVEAVGINGGEPSLIVNLPDFAEQILKLPKIKSLNIISHGFSTKLILKAVEKIYSLCKEANVTFHISISLDGYKDIHDEVRGRPKTFEKTMATIDEIHQNKHKYCDSIDLGCTVVSQNIDHLIELDQFTINKNYDIKFRLGIENKRIESDKLTDQFSVLYSDYRQSAKEFFHYKFISSNKLNDKFKYFAIYYWLRSAKTKRLLGCMWKEEGVTLDSRGELYYCAVASESLGTLREEKGEAVFFSDKNINYRKELITNSCDGCIHDYSGTPEIPSLLIFFREFLFEKLSMKIYKLKLKIMR